MLINLLMGRGKIWRSPEKLRKIFFSLAINPKGLQVINIDEEKR